jgi:hypothetical protein
MCSATKPVSGEIPGRWEARAKRSGKSGGRRTLAMCVAFVELPEEPGSPPERRRSLASRYCSESPRSVRRGRGGYASAPTQRIPTTMHAMRVKVEGCGWEVVM